jgi:nicotinamide riboside kinase
VNAIDAAQAFINEHFPNCEVAFLAGSASRGQETLTSDLDIVIFTSEHVSYNKSLHEFGWPIEIFVEDSAFYKHYLARLINGCPTMAVMCAEGVVIKDTDGLAQQIKDEANRILEAVPVPFTERQIRDFRYGITKLLEDLTDTEDFGENIFNVNRLTVLTCHLLLAHKHQWTGEGKWLLRSLRKADTHIAEQFVEALEAFYRKNAKEKLIQFVNDVLELVGGKLSDGYTIDFMNH